MEKIHTTISHLEAAPTCCFRALEKANGNGRHGSAFHISTFFFRVRKDGNGLLRSLASCVSMTLQSAKVKKKIR